MYSALYRRKQYNTELKSDTDAKPEVASKWTSPTIMCQGRKIVMRLGNTCIPHIAQCL